jgi:tRNA pseudouridine32 synthase/23S rRNA pseudouridine746 synthase
MLWFRAAERQRMSITVRHADPALLVLEKPAGMLSVPGRGPDKQDCLSARVQQQFPDAQIVHRLDMATSGLMLMARGTQALSILNRAFAERQVDKRYQALVCGRPACGDAPWQVIDLPIAVDWPNRPLRVIDEQGKPSLTRWRVLDMSHPGMTRLELEPVTGRSHQLRVHLRAIGHPIVGDRLYGQVEGPGLAGRLMLHATHIRLRHPTSGALLEFSSEPGF